MNWSLPQSKQMPLLHHLMSLLCLRKELISLDVCHI